MSYREFSNFEQILIFCEGVRCGNLRTCQVFISAPIMGSGEVIPPTPLQYIFPIL
jgi:hypothetical protein